MRISRLFTGILIILIVSCSIDYKNAEVAEEIDENIPDSIIENFYYTSINNGMLVFRLYAQKASSFSKKKETLLEDVVFKEYDKEGNTVTEGTADEGTIFTESSNAELKGSLKIYSHTNETEISAEYLYWNDEDKMLTGRETEEVKLKEDSGTRITGTGFSGDIRTRTFNFDGKTYGSYHVEED